VGVALVLAMLVTPASTAYLLTRRLPIMMSVAAAIGALSSLVGLYLSFYADLPSGPVIVLVQTVLFLVVVVFSRRRSTLLTNANTNSQS
jgi:ABC-type Mn2+/Zn2+ transport system permease subunit